MVASVQRHLADIEPCVRSDYPGWWAAAQIARGPATPAEVADLMLQAMATALHHDRGAARARALVTAGCLDVGGAVARDLLGMLDQAPRLRHLAARVTSARGALAVYLAAQSVIDGERAAGRVFLEDLAEALLMPPTLVRLLRRRAASAVERHAAVA